MSVRRIGRIRSKRIDVGAILDLQLKASINWTVAGDHLVFDLEADAYNRLVLRRDNSSIPCALVVCCLPKENSSWLNVCEEELTIRKCCYYYFIKDPETKNTSSKRLHIPRAQLFTPDALKSIADSISAGVAL